MAELPSVPFDGPTTKPIQSGLSMADISSPYTMLAENLKKAGSTADEVATSLAEQAGAKAVTTDANGNVQIDHPLIIGPAAKAFNDSVKLAALAQAEQSARRTNVQMREEYLNKDDPSGYLQAGDKFSKTMGAQYEKAGGPVLGLAVRKQLDSMVTTTYQGLANEHERLELHRNAATLNAELQHETDAIFGMANGGVTSGKEWKESWDKINTIYDHFQNNPRMGIPKEQIVQEKAKLLDELTVRGMQYHIVEETYGQGIVNPAKPEERETNPQVKYAAAATAAHTMLTDPKLNLSPAQRETYYNRTMAGLNDRARQDQAVIAGIGKQADAVAKTATDGYPVAPEQIAQLKTAAGATGDPGIGAAVSQAEQVVRTMDSFRTMSPATLSSAITDLRASGAPEPMIKGAETMLKNMREGLAKDPVAWADRTGTMPMPPIQFEPQPGGANEMRNPVGQMHDRAAAAETVARYYGVAPTYLRQDEKNALEAVTARGGTATVALARMIQDGFGDRAPLVMKELGKDPNSFAHIGLLNNQALAIDAAQGRFLRTDPVAQKTLPASWTGAPGALVFQAQNNRVNEIYGDALNLMPDGKVGALAATQDAFLARAVRNGYEPTLGQGRMTGNLLQSSDSEAAFDKALQESVGANFIGDAQYGGVTKYAKPTDWPWQKTSRVLVPDTVRADKFRDVIGAITDDHLRVMANPPVASDGRPFTARDLQASVPYALSNGHYAFARGDAGSVDPKYLTNAQGQRWELDWNQIEPLLRPLKPDAFLGIEASGTAPARAQRIGARGL